MCQSVCAEATDPRADRTTTQPDPYELPQDQGKSLATLPSGNLQRLDLFLVNLSTAGQTELSDVGYGPLDQAGLLKRHVRPLRSPRGHQAVPPPMYPSEGIGRRQGASGYASGDGV